MIIDPEDYKYFPLLLVQVGHNTWNVLSDLDIQELKTFMDMISNNE